MFLATLFLGILIIGGCAEPSEEKKKKLNIENSSNHYRVNIAPEIKDYQMKNIENVGVKVFPLVNISHDEKKYGEFSGRSSFTISRIEGSYQEHDIYSYYVKTYDGIVESKIKKQSKATETNIIETNFYDPHYIEVFDFFRNDVYSAWNYRIKKIYIYVPVGSIKEYIRFDKNEG